MVLLVCGLGIRDTINNYLEIELTQINHYKNRLYVSEDASGEQIEKLYDDYSHDSSKTLGIEIKRDGELAAKSIFVTDAGDSVRVLDENWQTLSLEDDGVYMTRKLAELDGYKIGDEIEWHIMGSHTYYRTKIIGLNRDPQNQNLTMTRAFYESLGLEYKPDSIYTDKAVDGLPEGVDSVQAIDAVRDGMNQMLDTMMTLAVILIVFAALLGAIIIYNMGMAVLNPGDETIIPEITFAVYETITRIMHAVPVFSPMKESAIDLDDIYSRITDKTKIIFICNPNNPTGQCLPPEKLKAFLKKVPENIFVFLDEAYIDFTEPEYNIGSVELLRGGMKNLFILRVDI